GLLWCLGEILDFTNLTVKMRGFEGDVDWANTEALESTPSRHYCGISAKLDKLPRCFRPRGASPISIGLRFRAPRNLLARIDTRFALHAEELCSPTVTACLPTEPDAGPGMLPNPEDRILPICRVLSCRKSGGESGCARWKHRRGGHLRSRRPQSAGRSPRHAIKPQRRNPFRNPGIHSHRVGLFLQINRQRAEYRPCSSLPAAC